MKTLLISTFLFCFCSTLHAAVDPADLARLDEALSIAEVLGPRVWPGFAAGNAPIILVRGESEYLLNSDSPAAGFTPVEGERFRNRPVFVRARTFPPNLLASFPAIGRDAVVVGTPEATGRAPAEWVLTICHELFHVYQGANGMVRKVNSLEIGPPMDPSWQLAYKFPYEDRRVVAALHILGHEMAVALRGNPAVVHDALQNLLDLLTPKDAAYLRFVVTKEGTARYFEYRLAQLAAKEKGGAYLDAWTSTYAPMTDSLEHLGLDPKSRSEFYPLGLGLGLLLDAADPAWQRTYFDDGVWLDETALRSVR